MDIVLYHAHCPDGWVAAYIASKKYPEAMLIPLDHGTDFEYVIDSLAGKDVLMVDFSFKTREQNIRASRIAKSFMILDHHKTAREKLEGLDFAVFDMNRSGAGLAWDYLFGKDSNYDRNKVYDSTMQYRPWWVNYTELRDLWRWESQPDSREICAYLGTFPFTKEAWDEVTEQDLITAKIYGRGAVAHIDHYVREVVARVQHGFFDGLKVGVANVTYLNCSEVGNEIAKNAVFSLTWFEREDEMIQFSLRSIGDFDVSEIAKKFQGGGHRNAAGFSLSIREGRLLVDKILSRDTRGHGPTGSGIPHS